MTRRRKITLISLSALVLIYLLVGFFYVPVLVRNTVSEQAESLNVNATLGKIRFNPLTLTLEMNDFSSKDSQQRHLLGFSQMIMNLQISSIFRQALVLKDVSIDQADVHVELLADGSIHWQELFVSQTVDETASESQAEPLDVIIDRLSIAQSGVSFHEPGHADAYQTRFDNLNFTLKNLDTRPDKSADFQLVLNPENRGDVGFSGRFSVSPLSLQGRVTLKEIDLAAPWRYARHLHGIELASGQLNAGLNVNLGLGAEGTQLNVESGELTIDNLSVEIPGEASPLLELDSLSLGPFTVDSAERDVIIEQVQLSSADAFLRRKSDGRLSLVERIESVQHMSEDAVSEQNSPQAEIISSETSGTAWQVIIVRTTLAAADLNWLDESVAPAVTSAMSVSELSVDQFNALAPELIDYTIRLTVDSGELASTGSLSIPEQSISAKLNLTAVPLTGFQGYLNEQVSLAVTDGSVDAALVVSSGDKLDLEGSLSLNDVRVINQRFSDAENSELISFGSLRLENINLTDQPSSIRIGELSMDQPVLSLNVDSDAKTILDDMVIPLSSEAVDTDESASTSATSTQDDVMQLTLDALVIDAGEISIRDDSTDPDYRMSMSQIDGRIEGLTNVSNAPAEVNVNATIDGYTDLTVAGTLSPLRVEHDTQLTISTRNVELTSLNPYAGKYIGRLMNRGQLGLDLEYSIKGRQLTGTNVISLGQIDLGDNVESADAVSIPLDLAVALLKDSDGNIELSVPVSGELDDPEFRIGSIVFRAIMNLLLKTVASPFTLLTKLVPGGSEDMQFVTFDAASDDLADSDGQLAAIANLLDKRPGLRLDVPGLAYRNLDGMQIRMDLYARDNDLEGYDRAAVIEHMRASLLPSESTSEAGDNESGSGDLDESTVLESALSAYSIDEDDLLQLATRRAQSIKVALIEIDESLADRVFVLEPRVVEQSGSNQATLELKLGVN